MGRLGFFLHLIVRVLFSFLVDSLTFAILKMCTWVVEYFFVSVLFIHGNKVEKLSKLKCLLPAPERNYPEPMSPENFSSVIQFQS